MKDEKDEKDEKICPIGPIRPIGPFSDDHFLSKILTRSLLVFACTVG
jgi:hypothetical protein